MFGQSLSTVLTRAGFGKGLSYTISAKGEYMEAFGRKYKATVTFTYAESSVYYFVFDYKPVDSLAFWNGIAAYNMAANCNFEEHDDSYKNFYTFNKNGYFFLLQHCPCRTVKDEDCATLALLLNQWAMKEE